MTAEIVSPFLPVLGCIMVIGSHGWLLTRRRRAEIHKVIELFVVLAYGFFLIYYGLHLREAWMSVSA